MTGGDLLSPVPLAMRVEPQPPNQPKIGAWRQLKIFPLVAATQDGRGAAFSGFAQENLMWRPRSTQRPVRQRWLTLSC